MEVGKTEDLEVQSKLTLVDADENETYEETVVDYPFPYGKEDWRLIMCSENTEDERKNHRFQIYDDNGKLIRDFPCEIQADEIVYRLDNLFGYYGASSDLAVFPADAVKSGRNGLLYTWDDDEDLFVEEPIVIPWYDEVRNEKIFLVTEKRDDTEEKNIYFINDKTRQQVGLRSWTLTGDGHLYIWDCLEEVVIYDGNVGWNDMGKLVNDKYYQAFFGMICVVLIMTLNRTHQSV